MRWETLPFERREPPLGAIYGGVLAACALLAVVWSRLDLPRPLCPLREASGLPCPTCGATRMVDALLRGDAAAALALNPLLFLGIVGVAFWALGSILRRALRWPRPRLVLGPDEKLRLRIAAIAVILGGWGYVILVDGLARS